MITGETLTDLGACVEGVAWFQARYPDGLRLEAWTRNEQIAALREGGGRWVAWGIRKSLISWWSMFRANLRGADLSEADLRGANLSGANLSGAIVCNHTIAPDGFVWPDGVVRVED